MSDITPVEAMDSSKENSRIEIPSEMESTVMIDKAADTCVWNGQSFSDGQQVGNDGKVYECSYGKWVLIED